MKKTILLLLTFVLASISYSQIVFTPGWYIVEKGATYTDYDAISLITGESSSEEDDTDVAFLLKPGEVIFATEMAGDTYYCFDPAGKAIIIKGKAALTKAPHGFGVGIIIEEIQMITGESISAGMYVWIVGQDIAKQTIKIQLNENQNIEIPDSKIALLTALIKKNSKASWFREVE